MHFTQDTTFTPHSHTLATLCLATPFDQLIRLQPPPKLNCTMAANAVSAHPEAEKLEAREMRGDGVYTANTKGCFDVINTAGVGCAA